MLELGFHSNTYTTGCIVETIQPVCFDIFAVYVNLYNYLKSLTALFISLRAELLLRSE